MPIECKDGGSSSNSAPLLLSQMNTPNRLDGKPLPQVIRLPSPQVIKLKNQFLAVIWRARKTEITIGEVEYALQLAMKRLAEVGFSNPSVTSD